MGKNLVQNFILHEHRNSVVSVLRDALAGKERANFELQLFTKDGVSVDLLLNATTRRDANGDGVIGVVMVGQDVTEMLTAQKEANRVAREMVMLIDTASNDNTPTITRDAICNPESSSYDLRLSRITVFDATTTG